MSGTGRALPARRVPSTEIDRRLGFEPGRLERLTGVESRFVCEAESQIDLAVTAARTALGDAGLAPDDLDLVIAAAAVPYQPIPATAPLIMRELGLADGAAAAFDVNSTCLSFVTALDTAARQIVGGAARHALIVSAEIASRALPWQDQPEVAALFGDGAAAAVLSPATGAENGRIAALRLRTYPSGYGACGIGAGGTRFDFARQPAEFAANALFGMDGKELFRLATRHFADFTQALLAEAGWNHDLVDLVVPHQASPAALAHLIRQTGFEASRVIDITRTHGNQIAASIPFALDLARREGRVREGDRVLLLGTSAGVSLGGAALVA